MNQNNILESDSIRAAFAELKKMADPHCKKCYGRGVLGRNITTNEWLPCMRCVKNYRKKEVQNAKIHQ